MKLYWIKVDPKSNDWYPYKKAKPQGDTMSHLFEWPLSIRQEIRVGVVVEKKEPSYDPAIPIQGIYLKILKTFICVVWNKNVFFHKFGA